MNLFIRSDVLRNRRTMSGSSGAKHGLWLQTNWVFEVWAEEDGGGSQPVWSAVPAPVYQ